MVPWSIVTTVGDHCGVFVLATVIFLGRSDQIGREERLFEHSQGVPGPL